MEDLKKYGVVILAAGESSRMAYPKAFLRYNSKMRFIDKIIDEYIDFGITNIVVVTNSRIISNLNLDENISVVINERLEYERFYSIKLGLEKAMGCDFCYIQNVDNPFVNEVILRKLYYKSNSTGSTVPVFNDKGGHPVLINKDIINKIIAANGSVLNFKDILGEFPSSRIEVNDDSILVNINTPEDYKNYFN
jgi:molybdenum cofactor cytidylyltransferase